MHRIGIVGAGSVGQACAQLFLHAGYEVMLSNSRDKTTLEGIAQQLPGVQVGSRAEAIAFGEMVLIAIPFCHYKSLPAALLAGKIVLDATNYYPDRDSRIAVLDRHETTTSQMMEQHLAQSRVVKVFNAIMARDVVKDAMPLGSMNKRALPVASDDEDAKNQVFALLARTGFDYVDGGTLAESWRFERAKPAYCIPLDKKQMLAALHSAERDVELPHNSWHRDNS